MLTDLAEFVHDHRPHGVLPPTPRSLRGMATCPCGVVFERWVTPEEADRDLVVMALRN